MSGCIWVRAIDYARAVKADNEGLCAHDYKSGAEEERILLLEWIKPNDEMPEEGVEVLVQLRRKFQMYEVAKWDGKQWWQPVAPQNCLEDGGWTALRDTVFGWRYIEEV